MGKVKPIYGVYYVDFNSSSPVVVHVRPSVIPGGKVVGGVTVFTW